MEADGRLARARSALHGEQAVERGADDLVLLGLDGGDDVEHLARAGPLELGEQCIPAPEASGGRLLAAATEQVVCHGDDLAAVHHDLAAPGQPESVPGARPVEGHRHGRPPVHDHGIGPCVLDVAPADVPGGTSLLVDTPEEERPWAVRQQPHPAREGGDIVKIGIPGGDEIVQQPLCPLPHGLEGLQGVLQVGLFGRELLVDRGRAHARGHRTTAKTRRSPDTQKSPDIPGTLLSF